jgi:hypothetical protein
VWQCQVMAGLHARDPRITALLFVSAIWKDHSLVDAWPYADAVLKLSLAQQWLTPLRQRAQSDGFTPDKVAAALAAGSTDHPLWHPFESKIVAGFQQWGDLERYAVGRADRPESADLELLHLYAPTEVVDGAVPPGRGDGFPVLMRFRPDGWGVLNMGSPSVPEPGWPPRLR